jgi:hypothetical protein
MDPLARGPGPLFATLLTLVFPVTLSGYVKSEIALPRASGWLPFRLSPRRVSEAALRARNFNRATRDRRFFPRLAVPPLSGAFGARSTWRNSPIQRLVWPAILA